MKWLDGSGTMGDSAVVESNGFLGIGTAMPTAPVDVNYSDNNFGFGFNVRNTNTGSQALAGYGIDNALGGRVGQYVYVPQNYVDASLRDSILFSSVGPAVKLGFVSSAEAGGSPDIFFRAGGGKPNSIYITGATGNVGVGTNAPAQRLDVAGNLKVTGASNGIIFPDGTKQTTAAVAAAAGLSAVAHDTTLQGNGTAASPLAVAAGGVGTNELATGAVTLSKIGAANSAASGQVLTFDGTNMVWGSPSAQSGGVGGAPYVWVCAPAYMIANSGSNPRTDLFIFNGGTTSASVAAHILDKDGNNLAGVAVPGTSPSEYYPGETGSATVPVAPGATRMVKWNGQQAYLGLTDAAVSIRVTSDQPIVVSATLQWSPTLTIPCSPLPK